MDVITTQDQAVATDISPNHDNKEGFVKKEKKKSERKKLKQKLDQIEEQNESMCKLINEKNTEISELRKSICSLNDVLNSVPIDELKCNSSIASNKILELSKKNRQLRSEMETLKHRSNRKDMQIKQLEIELKKLPEKMTPNNEQMKRESGSPANELQSKLNAISQKLFETRNRNVELTNQLKLAQKCIHQEIGEHFNLNQLTTAAITSKWRGRAQQIIHLQQKVQDLKACLKKYAKQLPGSYTGPCNYTDVYKGDTDDSIFMERPNVRRNEIQHRAKVDALESEIIALKSQLEDNGHKMLALKVRNKTLSEEISKHKIKTNTYEEQTDFNNLNIAIMRDNQDQQRLHYEKQISELMHDIKAFENQRAEFEIKEECANSKIDELEAIIFGKEEQIASLNDSIENLEADLKAVCGGFLFSCRELRKEEFITILDSLETEKNSLMLHNKTLNERILDERSKNDNLQDQIAKHKLRITRLETKIHEMERDIETQNDKKKRSQRIADYTASLSNISSTTSLKSFSFENTSIINCSEKIGDNAVITTNVSELNNRLELATEKIEMLQQKLEHISAEKQSDIKTFEQIISNSKKIIIETILAQRESACSEELTL